MADRKLFNLTENNTPPTTRRVAFGEDGELSENMTFDNLLEFLGINNKANEADVLTKTNTTVYAPATDYNPSTKKYVDDLNSSTVSYVNLTAGANVSNFVGKVAEAKNTVHFTGKFDDDNLQDGDVIFTIPTSITPPSIDVYVHGIHAVGGADVRAKIAAGTRTAIVEDQESSTGATMDFNASYLVSN